MMNWDAVGAMAEVAGVLAVISTLVYLALQTRHSALAVKLSAQQSTVAEIGGAMGSLMADPEGAEIWLKGTASFSSRTAVEALRAIVGNPEEASTRYLETLRDGAP